MRYKRRGKMAGKSNKLKIKKLQINLTNRWLYTLIVFFSLIVIGVFVYATAPNPGHDITQIAPPDVCGDGEFLKWTGSAWACETISSTNGDGTSLWNLSGSDIYYDDGNVGIGTTSPTSDYMLDVTGNAYFSGGIALEHMSEINTRPYLEEESTLWINCRGTSNRDQFRNTAIRDGKNDTIFYVKGSTGNVGIGTTEPDHKLEVDGGALISGNLHVGGFAAYSGAFIGYYNGTCDIGHTGVIRYVEDYCNGAVYMAGLQICTKTGTGTASWKFANSYSYGSCYTGDGGGGGGCFPAGTKVIMFDNSLKNIEDIKEGDYVLSYNEESGEYVSSKVEKLFVHTEENTEKWSEGLYNIFTSDRSNRRITGNHPVYTKTDAGWKYDNVENLALGDVVKIYNNNEPKEVYIVSIDFIEEDLKVVYNLRLRKPNTYFAEGLLVHNLKDINLPL